MTTILRVVSLKRMRRLCVLNLIHINPLTYSQFLPL